MQGENLFSLTNFNFQELFKRESISQHILGKKIRGDTLYMFGSQTFK